MAGIYIHFPFCLGKCPYCDFYSIPAADDFYPTWLAGVFREMDLIHGLFPPHRHRVNTVYLGGGTPSLMPPSMVKSLLERVARIFTLVPHPEITMEVNPATVSMKDGPGLAKAGVNRVSVGVQSFRAEECALLGRRHTPEQSRKTLRFLKKDGHFQTGLDLIFGLPGQSLNQWRESLEEAVAWEPDHISTYALSWSERTPLGRKIIRGDLIPCGDPEAAEMALEAHRVLSGSGYEHYELSNFALPGRRCRHNEGYWTGTHYLGLGPSAHSFTGSLRWWNVSSFDQYIEHLEAGRRPVGGEEKLTPAMRKLENIFLGLRRQEGISLDMLEGRERDIRALVDGRLASLERGRLILTQDGFLVADEITQVLTR